MVCGAGWYVFKISLSIKKVSKILWKESFENLSPQEQDLCQQWYVCNKLLAQSKSRLSTHRKELYCPPIKHSVRAAVI